MQVKKKAIMDRLFAIDTLEHKAVLLPDEMEEREGLKGELGLLLKLEEISWREG